MISHCDTTYSLNTESNVGAYAGSDGEYAGAIRFISSTIYHICKPLNLLTINRQLPNHKQF